MKFGVFDHMDDSGSPLWRHYENRLRVIEAYDAGGFYAYHLAEHHATPIGFAPSPGLFLAAVAQRTKRLRFGPLVYPLPFYNPLRLLEEICMLDHLSEGRLELGIGRGISPTEAAFYGIDPGEMQAMYEEALEILRHGFVGKSLEFAGTYNSYDKVPITLRPYQKPHPPLWYGASSPSSVVWAAKNNVNIVTLALADQTRTITDLYKSEWTANGESPEAVPLMGVSRHIVVADSDKKAMEIASRAYPKWLHSFRYLHTKYRPNAKLSPIAQLYPETFEELQRIGNGIAGSPDRVRAFVSDQIDRCGTNYMVSWLAFGDLSLEEAMTSTQLFSQEIIAKLDNAGANRLETGTPVP